jgi:hypothetical protein
VSSNSPHTGGRIVGTPGLDLTLLIECELLTQEQILSRERSSGAQAEAQKVTRSPKILNQLKPASINARSLRRRRWLVKILRARKGFKLGTNIFADHSGKSCCQRRRPTQLE